jgi:uncharacterized membrane protein
MMGFGFGGMLLFWGVLLALLGGGATLVFRQLTGTGAPAGQQRRTARQILDERLARGEISREEYDLIRARVE